MNSWGVETEGWGEGVARSLQPRERTWAFFLGVEWEDTGGCEQRSDVIWLVFLEDQ